jgi:hypothetical protein
MRYLILALLLLSGPAYAADPILPDPKMTPGAALPVTAKDICVPGYAGRTRNVPQHVKDKAYELYGIETHKAGDYEVDHLISLELGGSNDISNLWPESFHGTWNAHDKDRLENRLHELVCDDKMELSEAQTLISTNWIKAYCKVMNTANCNGVNIQ